MENWFEEMEQAEQEYDAKLQDESRAYEKGYQQGRADAIDEILKRIFDDIESHTEKIGERIYKSYPNCQMIVDKLE